MFSGERNLIVRKEQYKDWQRNMEQQKLLQANKSQQQADKAWPQEIAGWLGGQMTKWGTKLQGQEPTLPAKAMSHQNR